MQDVDKIVTDKTNERRRFVRVKDAVGLQLQRLVERPAAGHPTAGQQPSGVRKIDKYAIEGYAAVRKDYPAVAQYISDLEERIRELLLDGDDASSKPTHMVGLSAGGLSFSDRKRFVPGEQVTLSLTLFPSGTCIGADAVIVKDDASGVPDQESPIYRAEFVRISDHDRQVIKAHVDQLLSKRAHLGQS